MVQRLLTWARIISCATIAADHPTYDIADDMARERSLSAQVLSTQSTDGVQVVGGVVVEVLLVRERRLLVRDRRHYNGGALSRSKSDLLRSIRLGRD